MSKNTPLSTFSFVKSVDKHVDTVPNLFRLFLENLMRHRDNKSVVGRKSIRKLGFAKLLTKAKSWLHLYYVPYIAAAARFRFNIRHNISYHTKNASMPNGIEVYNQRNFEGNFRSAIKSSRLRKR